MLHKIFQKGVYGLILLGVCTLLFLSSMERQQINIGKKLRPQVLRFHVLADNDGDEAQALKLLVRDRLLREMEPWLAEAEDREAVMEILTAHQGELKELAEDTLKQHNCDLSVKVELTESWFPVKQYGSLVMPAGEYEALRVSIGRAKGRNWWCMLFPGLCFVDETYELREEDAAVLQEILTEEEFQAIWQNSRTKVKVRFWLWERLEHYLNRNSTNEELNSKTETCRIK